LSVALSAHCRRAGRCLLGPRTTILRELACVVDRMATPTLQPPQSARGPRVMTPGSTTMRRRVLQSAALAEWDAVREAVEKSGCNVNIQDETSGLSLVHWAAHQGNEESLRWLIAHGAFVRPKDKRGEPPLTGARGPATAVLLEEAYSPPERALYQRGMLDEARLEAVLGGLPASALDEPLADEAGATLVVALAGRHGGEGLGPGGALDAVPLLRWLHAHGASLEAADEEGNALLHMVDWSLGAAVVAPLVAWALQEGKVLHKDARNQDGDTPALLCAYSSPSGDDALRCLELLEAAGANLSLGNSKGINTAMALARYQGDGPWLGWCHSKAGVEPNALCARGRTVAQYLALYGAEESDEDAGAAA